MFMRLLNIQVKLKDMGILRFFYDNIVIIELQKFEGCLFVSPHSLQVLTGLVIKRIMEILHA